MKFSTFSIIARDPDNGLLGVAGGTNWFNYGRWVPHIEAGFGALATQAETNMEYALRGLENLKKGLTAQKTVEDMMKRDPDKKGVYQLLVIDNLGNTFCHTGRNCHEYSGHICKQNLAVAGNTLVSEETLTSVIGCFEDTKGSLALRMIRALQAGQMAGGDIRGMRSSAIKIVKGRNSGKYWNDIVYDLRVDENNNPLEELERLYTIAEAYMLIYKAESTKDYAKALTFYQKALILDPDNDEILFWMARIYDQQGNKVKSDEIRARLKSSKGHWDEFWRRLDVKARFKV